MNFNERDEDIFNGSLLKQSTYDNGNKLLLETANEYTGTIVTSPTIVNWYTQVASNQDNKSKLCKYVENGNTFYMWRRIQESTNPTCVDYRIYKTKYNINGYVIQPQSKVLAKQTQKIYDQLSDSYITSVNEFIYGTTGHTLPVKIIQTTSNGEQIVTEKKYPLDYSFQSANDVPTSGIFGLRSANIVGAEIESVQYRQNANGTNKRYINGSLNVYGGLMPVQLYGLSINQPLSSFTMSQATNGYFSYNSNYRLLGTLSYNNGNLVTQTKTNDVITSYIWDYSATLPTAQVVNADYSAIAYSSFETDQTGLWTVIPLLSSSRISGGITGNFAYQLTPGNTITKTSLPASQKYAVSYWSKSGSLNVSSNAGVVTLVTGSSLNGWTFYSHALPANTTSVSISKASTAIIDELRLCPSNAQMSTMTYSEHNGSMISQCDAVNNINYFEYDGYNRLINVKDISGHIVKNYQYNYGTNTTALTPSAQTLYYNTPQQGTFYRTCTPPAEPEPYMYKVPYGRYASVNNVTEANQKAIQDVQTNGPVAASQFGICLFWNDNQQVLFYKNNCQYWEGPPDPNGTWYIVPPHTISSTISKADANQKALDLIAANGQANANNFGFCTCTMTGYRFVNGQCEAGQISYAGFVYQPGCGGPGINYKCYYFYYFSDGFQSAIMEMCTATPCQQY